MSFVHSSKHNNTRVSRWLSKKCETESEEGAAVCVMCVGVVSSQHCLPEAATVSASPQLGRDLETQHDGSPLSAARPDLLLLLLLLSVCVCVFSL